MWLLLESCRIKLWDMEEFVCTVTYQGKNLSWHTSGSVNYIFLKCTLHVLACVCFLFEISIFV